jgi:type II secretory pathway pseudopilin PulG
MPSNIEKRSALTLVEVLVVFLVIGILIALLLPALLAVRGTAMKFDCECQLRNIGSALHNYTQANNGFPPGAIYGTDHKVINYPVDVWAAAAAKGVTGTTNNHGTSWILSILPYIEWDTAFKQWDFTTNVAGNAIPMSTTSGKYNHNVALCEVKILYCVARRACFRKEIDDAICLRTDGTWTGGGTDYGGCAGRVYGWATDDPNHPIQDPDSKTLLPPYTIPPNSVAGQEIGSESGKNGIGIFFHPNHSTQPKEITDGTSNTIMTGELQRITTPLPKNAIGPSHDGWAVGGDATTFSTSVANPNLPDNTMLMNNLDFRSPGSEHSGVVNFGMADGCVRSLSINIDPTVFALMGSMADGAELGYE